MDHNDGGSGDGVFVMSVGGIVEVDGVEEWKVEAVGGEARRGGAVGRG